VNINTWAQEDILVKTFKGNPAPRAGLNFTFHLLSFNADGVVQ
jgi:hypothetical protein